MYGSVEKYIAENREVPCKKPDIYSFYLVFQVAKYK